MHKGLPLRTVQKLLVQNGYYWKLIWKLIILGLRKLHWLLVGLGPNSKCSLFPQIVWDQNPKAVPFLIGICWSFSSSLENLLCGPPVSDVKLVTYQKDFLRGGTMAPSWERPTLPLQCWQLVTSARHLGSNMLWGTEKCFGLWFYSLPAAELVC